MVLDQLCSLLPLACSACIHARDFLPLLLCMHNICCRSCFRPCCDLCDETRKFVRPSRRGGYWERKNSGGSAVGGRLRKTHVSICTQCNNEGGQGVAAHCAKMGATHLFFFAHCTATTIISFCAAWRACAIGRHGALHARKQCNASFSVDVSNAIWRDFFPRACCLSIVAPVVHLQVHALPQQAVGAPIPS